MCKETRREFFRVQGRNSRPLPHLFTRLLALHSQISSPITCRHTARRSDPYHDQSARAILGTAFKGTRRISSQGVFRLQAVSGHGTGNTASWTPIHWPHRGEHPIRGYRSWFCRAHQVPYQSQNRRKGLSCIVRMQSYTRIIPGSTTKPGDQWIPKKLKTVHRAPQAPEKIYSDNGKTFVGAEKWLKQVMRDEKTQNYLPHENIKWQFNLSRAALWGGQFECLIGLVKTALNKTIGYGMLTWTELCEVVLDVEKTTYSYPCLPLTHYYFFDQTSYQNWNHTIQENLIRAEELNICEGASRLYGQIFTRLERTTPDETQGLNHALGQNGGGHHRGRGTKLQWMDNWIRGRPDFGTRRNRSRCQTSSGEKNTRTGSTTPLPTGAFLRSGECTDPSATQPRSPDIQAQEGCSGSRSSSHSHIDTD